jgi:hypothetical protein
VILNRFTSLPIAVDVLYRKRITLLTPDFWEDENDASNDIERKSHFAAFSRSVLPGEGKHSITGGFSRMARPVCV